MFDYASDSNVGPGYDHGINSMKCAVACATSSAGRTAPRRRSPTFPSRSRSTPSKGFEIHDFANRPAPPGGFRLGAAIPFPAGAGLRSGVFEHRRKAHRNQFGNPPLSNRALNHYG